MSAPERKIRLFASRASAKPAEAAELLKSSSQLGFSECKAALEAVQAGHSMEISLRDGVLPSQVTRDLVLLGFDAKEVF